MSEFTPGPWVVESGTDICGDGRLIAEIKGRFDPRCRRSQIEADARLIGAAPDLFAALSIMVDVFGENEHEGPFALSNARAALAKAEGKTS